MRKSEYFNAARDAVILRDWTTPRCSKEILAEINAIDADTMRPVPGLPVLGRRAAELNVRRPNNPGLHSMAAAQAAKMAAVQARWATEWAPLVAEMRARGASWWAIRMRLNTSSTYLAKFRAAYGYEDSAPPRPAPTPTPAAAPPIRVQTVEEWLAAGGQITRCPTAMAVPCQADIPEADREAMRDLYAYREAMQAGKRKRAGEAWREGLRK